MTVAVASRALLTTPVLNVLQALCVLMVTQNVIELLVGLKALPKYAKVRADCDTERD